MCMFPASFLVKLFYKKIKIPENFSIAQIGKSIEILLCILL